VSISETERPLQEQCDLLTRRKRRCVEIIRQWWETDDPPMSNIIYLRFARFAQFDVWHALKVMKKFDERRLALTMTDLKR
jgi:hypothetical protein